MDSKLLIIQANKKIPIIILLNKYNISFDDKDSGWCNISCPLPEHNDSTPSFGFNLSVNAFNCFGCHKSGGPVQFEAFMSGSSFQEAASRLLGASVDLNDLETDSDEEKISTLLLEHSDTIREFVENNNSPQAKQFADTISWSLDVYLRKNLPGKKISMENLMSRLTKLKGYLKDY